MGQGKSTRFGGDICEETGRQLPEDQQQEPILIITPQPLHQMEIPPTSQQTANQRKRSTSTNNNNNNNNTQKKKKQSMKMK